MTNHVFAQTIHDVTASHGFAGVITSATNLYIPCFIYIYSGVSGSQKAQICLFPLLSILALQQLALSYKSAAAAEATATTSTTIATIRQSLRATYHKIVQFINILLNEWSTV